MRKFSAIAFAVLIGFAAAHGQVWAQDNDDDDDTPAAAEASAPAEKPTRASKNVPELILGSKEDQFAVNQKNFELIAGQGYRWKISAAGGLEYKFHTDLFRDVWMNQIVIEDLEVHMNGAPAWLEYRRRRDDPDTVHGGAAGKLHLVRPRSRGQGHDRHDHGQMSSRQGSVP